MMTVDAQMLSRAVLCLAFFAFLAYTEPGARLFEAGLQLATQVFSDFVLEPILERAGEPTTPPASVQP
jgi:hypothetical protein